MDERPLLLHNRSTCSKTRDALQLLRERGVEPVVVDLMESRPDVEQLRAIASRAGGARALLRAGEPMAAALGLDDPDADESALLAAMAAHPELVERPVFVHGSRAIVGRPPERVLDLLGPA